MKWKKTTSNCRYLSLAYPNVAPSPTDITKSNCICVSFEIQKKFSLVHKLLNVCKDCLPTDKSHTRNVHRTVFYLFALMPTYVCLCRWLFTVHCTTPAIEYDQEFDRLNVICIYFSQRTVRSINTTVHCFLFRKWVLE